MKNIFAIGVMVCLVAFIAFQQPTSGDTAPETPALESYTPPSPEGGVTIDEIKELLEDVRCKCNETSRTPLAGAGSTGGSVSTSEAPATLRSYQSVGVPLTAASQWEVSTNSPSASRFRYDVVMHTLKYGNCPACDEWIKNNPIPSNVNFKVKKDIIRGTAPAFTVCDKTTKQCKMVSSNIPLSRLLMFSD
jgi:hypothetical protein